MTVAQIDRHRLGHIVERCDFWRRSPSTAGGPGGHKEWVYFSVLGDDIDLIVNLSIMDGVALPAGAPARAEEARLTMLARTHDQRWHGDVEQCDRNAVTLQAGRVDARFGASTLAFADGAYQLDARLPSRGVSARIALRPVARPALTRSVPLGSDQPMHWVVVPRLEASGEVCIGGSRYPLRNCPAYHDHNWGRFSWGGDFAWEWGIVLAATSWSLVYYRITDRGRHQVMAQGVLVWCDDCHVRTFRDRQVGVRSTGLLRLGRCLRVPRIMSLAMPGTACDVPRRLEIEARSGRDALDIIIDLDDGAQIGVPNDGDEGLTSISECRGRAHVSGYIAGEPVCLNAPSVVEFNRAG